MKRVAEKGLVVDVNFPWQTPDGFFALREQVPELKIVLEHVSAVKVNGEPPTEHWLETMRRAAENPNTTKKVSALMENSAEQPAPPDLRVQLELMVLTAVERLPLSH